MLCGDTMQRSRGSRKSTQVFFLTPVVNRYITPSIIGRQQRHPATTALADMYPFYLLIIKNSLYDLHEFFLDKLSSNLRDGILSTTSGQFTIRECHITPLDNDPS